MWTKGKQCITAALFVASFLCLPSVGFCSGGAGATYTITAEELTTLEQHLTMLQNNNETLKSILSASGEELTEALNALTTSQAELAKLKAELNLCKAEAESARQSLQTANSELQKALESVNESEREHRRRETQLERQRVLWQIIAVIVGGVAIAK